MRIALAWIVEAPLTSITVRYERYVRGFRALGHDVVTVCHKAAAVGYEFPTLTTDDLASFNDPTYWKSIGADLVLVVSWLSFPKIIEAIRESGSRVVAVSDSDGIKGVRVFPMELLCRMIAQHTHLRDKLGAVKHWLDLYSRAYLEADQIAIRSAAASDSIAVTSEGARSNLKLFFEYHNRADLVHRIVVAPYPVDEAFVTDCNDVSSKKNQVLAIGRWDDPQKGTGLLIAGLDSVAAHAPDTTFLIIGRADHNQFAAVCRRHSNVQYRGVLTASQIAEHLRESRSLLTTSRWESGPIVLNEALTSGCTVIGPRNIPTVRAVCENGLFGTQFTTRTPASVAAAVLAELREWAGGRRVPKAIAETWRPLFSSQHVCSEMIRFLRSSRVPSPSEALSV